MLSKWKDIEWIPGRTLTGINPAKRLVVTGIHDEHRRAVREVSNRILKCRRESP